MREDNKPSNIACKSFVPHRFKATQCGRCFKSHAQHTQFMKGIGKSKASPQELQPRSNDLDSSSDEDSSLQLEKMPVRDETAILNRKNSQTADDGGNITTDYFTPDAMMTARDNQQPFDESDCKPRRHMTKKSAARRTREAIAKRTTQENGLQLNIPVDQTPTNNLSPVISGNGSKITESNGFDTISDTTSENNDNHELFRVLINTRNGAVNESQNNMTPNDSAGIQYLKAFRAARKSSIPVPKTSKETNRDMNKLQEFQEVARNLRHVPNQNVDMSETNGSHLQVSRTQSAPGSDASPSLNRHDVEERQKIMEAKSSVALSNTAFQTFSGHAKHDTLPRNLGSTASRPSIVSSAKHLRKLSDPEFFQPAEKEEMQVVAMSSGDPTRNQELSSKKQVVTTSKISSEIFFGTSSSNSRQRSPRQSNNNSDVVFNTFLDHTEKPVLIVAADGSVSHYRGSVQTDSKDPKSEHQGRRQSHPRNLTKPYKVVDVSSKPPQQPQELDVQSSPKLPLSPSPRYKSSDGDLSAKDDVAANVFHFKDSPSKFPKRNVTLVDGIYSMKDNAHLSHQEVTSPLSDADGDQTPPFPILLSESESDHSDRRRSSSSSNYKVPIFISPKNYDNVGTVLSDRESSMSDLSKDIPGTSGEGNYGYLTPLRPIKEGKQVEERGPPVPVRTSSETQLHSPSADDKTAKPAPQNNSKVNTKKPKRVQGNEANSNNSQSSGEPRWRSKTHPLRVEPVYAKVNVEAKKSNAQVTRSNTDVGKSKQKRVAPQPPNGENHDAGHMLPDSLPRGLPPPPPGKEKRKSSCETDEPSITRSVKPTAPSPPTESQLAVIYEAVDREQTVNNKTVPTSSASSSPLKQQPTTSNSSIQRPQVLGSSVTAQDKANPPHGRHSHTPTKHRVHSPTRETKYNSEFNVLSSPPPTKEVIPLSSPPRPMSPPIPCSRLELPDGSPYHSPNSKDAKSKRSKLPWKRRRKRDERGSPERDFDATVVEKWLEGVHQLKLEEDIQRNSIEKLEVINAYRGEQTAFIDHSDLQSPSLSTSPEQNGEDSDGSGVRMRATSSSKRRAPKPPDSGRPASWVEGTRDSPSGSTEDFLLQKSYSLSPHSKRRASDGDHLVQYENTGVLRQRQKKSAPPKPERRRRSMTTGFENLRSFKETDKPPVLKRQTSSDPDLTTIIYESLADAQPILSAEVPPLKSALKAPGSFETKKAETDPLMQPKRPVRIIAPEKDSSPQEPSFVNIYSNIEIVQRGLGSSDAKTSVSSVVFTAEAETQCGWMRPGESEAADELSDVGESILTMNRMTLARLATKAHKREGLDLDEPGLMRRPWEDNDQFNDQPCCTVPSAAFYKIVHPEIETAATAVMIGMDAKKDSDLLLVAQCSQTVSSHPNIMTICHASIEPVPLSMRQTGESEARISKESSPSAEGRVETAVIVTDRVPVTNVGNYVSHNKELHEYLPDKYEENVALLLLQLLSGIHHLQMHRVCLRGLKLDHLLLVDSSLPGGGSVLLINLLACYLQQDTHRDSQASSDIYGTPEQLAEKIAEFEVGILVYEFLHRTNPFATKTSLITQEYEPQHLPPVPIRSKFSKGLQRLAGELLQKKPSDRLSAGQAIGLLQCLLWGPPASLLEPSGNLEQALQRWLSTEQAKKVASMCEYCIPGSWDKDTGYSLADQLQCQFLSDTSVESLLESMKLLYQS